MAVLCPFCFKKINLNKCPYMCSSAACMEDGAVPPRRHIIRNPKVDRNGFCTCEKCGKTTSTVLCSECNSVLPKTIRDSETKIISIVGASSCGKSYFVGTLLRQIDSGLFSRINRASHRFCPGSREIYEDRYLSNFNSRKPLEATRKMHDLIKDNPPVLTQLTYTIKGKKVDNTYSFFDAAGESFHDAGELAAITPYISHSEAIVIILDPRQIPAVNAAVSAHMPNLPPVTKVTYSDIINNVVDVVRNDQRLNRRKKIGIPLCVAFSKWDLLTNTPDLLSPDLYVSQPSNTATSGFDINLINTISEEIKALLNRWDPGFVTAIETEFKEICYFGFSAWGPASTDGIEIPAIASFRVEDPMLWIMNRNKLL